MTQALDGRAGVEPDLSVREARRGDRYLLCSDGLSGYVPQESIAATLATPDPDEAAERLIELALLAGAPDNVTVVVADVVDDSAGLPVTPIVGGAAAEAESVPSAAAAVVLPGGASLTTEQRLARREAARLERQGVPPATGPNAESDAALIETPPTGMPPIVDEPPSRRSRRAAPTSRAWYRRPVVLGLSAVFVVVVAGIVITWTIAAGSWYVARSGDRVGLYHGLQSRPLGLSLSRVQDRGIALNQLIPVDLERVRSGIVAESHADGVCILARLKFNAQQAARATAVREANQKHPLPTAPPSTKASTSAAAKAPVAAPTRVTTPTKAPTKGPRPRVTPTPSPSISLPPIPTPLSKSCAT